MKKLLQLGFMAALLAFTALAVPATGKSVTHAAAAQLHSSVVHPHRAAASCVDDTCDGANPNSVGCVSGSYVAKSVNFTADGGGFVELLFNYSCHAGWAFIKFNNAMASGHTGDAAIYRTSNNSRSQYCETGGNGVVEPGQHSCYTAMLGDASKEQAEACGFYDDALVACTDTF